MALEIKVDDRLSQVEILSQVNNMVEVSIDGRIYNLDVERVADGCYSILHNNKSYTIDLLKGNSSRHYMVNMAYSTYDVHIIDAQAKYKDSRNKNQALADENMIFSPMPGKVVKLLVQENDVVEKGQTVIVISAMKMESEYKAGITGIIKKINCATGDTIDANQPLIIIE